MNCKVITFRQMLSQLRKDLIGKDSHRGVTLTYTWLANQFGHFSLGFIPSLLLTMVLEDSGISRSPDLRAAIAVSSFWAFFELFNFLGPLLAAGLGGKSQLTALKYTFPPAWGNIAFDTITDILFFCLGSFTAAAFEQGSGPALNISLLIGAVLMPVSYYWYLTKMYMQSAGYPSQIRLGQWEHAIDDGDRTTVQRFLEARDGGQHLLVFGSEASGKTALGVALATERSIRHEPCAYVSAMKLLSLFQQQEPLQDKAGENIWTWRNVSTLVIDDINPGEPVCEELIPAKTFFSLLSDNLFGAVNRQAFRQKNVIWVLGTDKAETGGGRQWENMLGELGVDRRNIHCINLSREGARKGRVISFTAEYGYRKQSLQDAAGF